MRYHSEPTNLHFQYCNGQQDLSTRGQRKCHRVWCRNSSGNGIAFENVIVFGVVTQVVMVSLLECHRVWCRNSSGNGIAFGMALQWRSGVCIAYWRNEQTEPRTSAVWQDFAKNKVQ